MRPALRKSLRSELSGDPEYAQGYAEAHLETFMSAQIKVLREQNGWSQAELASKIGVTERTLRRMESVNFAYSAWNIKTLIKLARAFRLRLRVSFETYGALIQELDTMDRENLERVPREADKGLLSSPGSSASRRNSSSRPSPSR